LQRFQAGRRTLTGRLEHGPEHGEIGAFPFGAPNIYWRVARYADHKTGRGDAPQTARRHGIAAQVHAVSAAGQGDIRAVVDEYRGSVRVGQGQHAADQGSQVSGAQVLFADLDPLDAAANGPRDRCDQRLNAPGQLPVRDVVPCNTALPRSSCKAPSYPEALPA
jgi:hypothetical protein